MIWLVFGIAFVLALGLPPNTLDGMVGAMVITFFGLLAAGFVSAISLLVSASLSGTYTVKRLEKVKNEVEHLCRLIISTISFIIAGGVFSVVAVIIGRYKGAVFCVSHDYCFDICMVVNRITQALIVSCLVISLDRMRLIRVAFFKSLEEKYKAAEDAAKLRVDENLSSIEIKSAFKRSGDFGKVVKIDKAEGAGNSR